MKLHKNASLFRQAILATSEMMDIPEIYIEKDYWVTLALKIIFEGIPKEYAVFKGGTALSKCYGLIERFSEDIDLVIIHTEGETENQKKNKIKKISKAIKERLPEIEIEGLTSKLGMIRKTCHGYPKLFKGIYGQVRDFIVIEASWLGYYEPYTEKPVSAYIYEMMLQRGQSKIAEEYEMEPFTLRVLSLERTLCEKIMSLVRFSYGENPLDDLRLKIRHAYDLKLLLDNREVKDFLESSEFEVMISKVGHDDLLGYRSNNEWLLNHPADALIFTDLEDVWGSLKTIYNGDFKTLIYGTLPPERQIYDALKTIHERLKIIEWDLEIKQ